MGQKSIFTMAFLLTAFIRFDMVWGSTSSSGDYELQLANPYQLVYSDGSSGSTSDHGIENEISSLDTYVAVSHSTPDSGTTYSGFIECGSGWAFSQIKIQQTVWKTFTQGISYMEFYCSPYTADGAVDTSQEVKQDSFGYDNGNSLFSVDCKDKAIAGIMQASDDDHLGVVCHDATIQESDYSALAGLYWNSSSATSGTGYNSDSYSLSLDKDGVSELWTESSAQTYYPTSSASWCLKDFDGDDFASGGAMTGLDYKYQRSRDSDCWTCNDNGLVFYLHASCHESTVLAPTPQAECGNGQKEDSEECDDGNNNNHDACTNDCKNAECGDGITETGVEECDDGNSSNRDACTNACKDALCGDGYVHNNNAVIAVPVSDIKVSGINILNHKVTRASSKFESRTSKYGGPSVIELDSEECDDGNTNNNDGCSSECKIEFCGDGIQQTSEACDDGNMADGDGCSSACTVEIPPTICGNGVLESGEECDDGNITSGDGCSSDCQTEITFDCQQLGQAVYDSSLSKTTDNDGDGFADACDLCPTYYDPNQNSTDVNDTNDSGVANGVPDECEIGVPPNIDCPEGTTLQTVTVTTNLSDLIWLTHAQPGDVYTFTDGITRTKVDDSNYCELDSNGHVTSTCFEASSEVVNSEYQTAISGTSSNTLALTSNDCVTLQAVGEGTYGFFGSSGCSCNMTHVQPLNAQRFMAVMFILILFAAPLIVVRIRKSSEGTSK